MARAGHTEAAVDLARLAGFQPVACLIEILNPDGTMARMPQLKEFAAREGLRIITIKDLIAYRLKEESLVERGEEVKMPTDYGDFRLIPFKQKSNGLEHVVLFKGKWEPGEPLLVRVHSSCVTGDIFGSRRCDCGEQLHKSMELIEKEGKGLVLYLNQEGRGIGLMAKIAAYKLQEQGLDTVDANVHLGYDPDERDYGVGAQILRALGVTKMRLITNNPVKRVGLEAYGLEIVENVPMEITPNEYNRRYLLTKQEILSYYINKVYMSNGNYGMQTAAQSYYGKDLKDLSIPQLALLAGMPQAPNQYDPYSHPEEATERRNLVLSEMQKQGYLTAEQYETAINTPITDGLQSLKSSNSYPPYLDNYLKEVIEQVENETGYNLLTTGMDVYTNVDQDVQKRLWDVYNTDEYVNYPDDEIQAASTIVDVTNGKVIAQLGSRHQSSNVSFGINQAVETNRDWGSTMKPITDYAPALEYGIYDSTAYMLKDVPYNYPGTNIPVYNWDRG